MPNEKKPNVLYLSRAAVIAIPVPAKDLKSRGRKIEFTPISGPMQERLGVVAGAAKFKYELIGDDPDYDTIRGYIEGKKMVDEKGKPVVGEDGGVVWATDKVGDNVRTLRPCQEFGPVIFTAESRRKQLFNEEIKSRKSERNAAISYYAHLHGIDSKKAKTKFDNERTLLCEITNMNEAKDAENEKKDAEPAPAPA